MKNLLLFLFCLTVSPLFAANGEAIIGQGTVRQSLVTFAPGSNNGKTRILFLANNVYVDTSATGQTGAFKRIDNTADSCSAAFPLAADTNGTIRPVWEYRLWETVRSVDKDSSTHVYRVQTREKVWDNAIKNGRWTPWTQKGANSGYADVTVQDSILIANAGTTAKLSQYTIAMFLGSWARLCPDDVAGTANGAADSVFADSIFVFTR